jgi:hypothetical protein
MVCRVGLVAVRVGSEQDLAGCVVVDLYVYLALEVGGAVEEEARDGGRCVRHFDARGVEAGAVEVFRLDLAAVQGARGESQVEQPILHTRVLRYEPAPPEVPGGRLPLAGVELGRVEILPRRRHPERRGLFEVGETLTYFHTIIVFFGVLV